MHSGCLAYLHFFLISGMANINDQIDNYKHEKIINIFIRLFIKFPLINWYRLLKVRLKSLY